MADRSPLLLLRDWIEEAKSSGYSDPDAMVISTIGADGTPNGRVVLCRRVDEDGLGFFTNYESIKGGEIAACAKAAATFFWSPTARQVRVRGLLSKATAAVSDAYFAQRPRGHQLSAWASRQSATIASIEEVRRRQSDLEAEYAGRDVPRPPYWGGYVLMPSEMEIWKGGADRLHSRSLYRRTATGWAMTKLSP